MRFLEVNIRMDMFAEWQRLSADGTSSGNFHPSRRPRQGLGAHQGNSNGKLLPEAEARSTQSHARYLQALHFPCGWIDALQPSRREGTQHQKQCRGRG